MGAALAEAGKKVAEALAKALTKAVIGNASKDKGKRTASILICVISLFIIIPTIAISLPGILLKDAVGKLFKGLGSFTFAGDELKEYDIYNDVEEVYVDYIEDLNEKVNNVARQLKKDCAYIKTEEVLVPTSYDSHGVMQYKLKKISYRVEPQIIKDINIEKPRYSHLMAYIAVKYVDKQGTDEDDVYKLDKDEAKDFLNRITIYRQSHTGKDPVYLKVKTTILSVEEIADEMFDSDLDKGKYITSYYSMEDSENELVEDLYYHIDLATLNIYENGIQIPHLLQKDERWKNTEYRKGTIGTKGSAPVCLAMVLSYFQNDTIRPSDLVQKMTTDYSNEWRIFEEISQMYGVGCVNIGKNSSKLVSAIENGNPVIAYMNKGELSSYVVIREVTSENKLLINDPQDVYGVKDIYKKEYLINEIYTKAKTFFVFNN